MSRSFLVVVEIAFIATIFVIAFFMFRKVPPSPDAVAVDVKMPDSRSQVYLEPDGNGYVYLLKLPDGSTERVPPDRLAQRLYQSNSTTGINRYLGPTSPAVLAWLGVGLMGQILFTGRMIVQWIASEKQKRSVVPPLFWWMSLVGSLMLLAYFLWRRDPIGLLGQLFGTFIYLRNIVLIYGTHHPEEIVVTKDAVEAA